MPAAISVDLPLPGTPVTRVRPLHVRQGSATSSSIASSSSAGGAPGSTRMVMFTPHALSTCTADRLTLKRCVLSLPSFTICAVSSASPLRKMGSAVSPKNFLHSRSMAGLSSSTRVARLSTPSTSTNAGQRV